MTHGYSHTKDDLIQLSQARQLPTFSIVLVRFAVTWAEWRKRARTRSTLKDLDTHCCATLA